MDAPAQIQYVNPPVPQLWSQNGVANGVSKSYWTEPGPGSLSLKTVRSGRADWSTSDGNYAIEPGAHLVLNHGQSYRLEIDNPVPVETFAVFFRPGLVEDVRASRTPVSDGLEGTAPRAFGFYERLELTSPGMAADLDRLYRVVYDPSSEQWEVEEAFLALAESLVDGGSAADTQLRGLPFARTAVREEVFRRLNTARDMLLSESRSRLDLEQVAARACLSPCYFHRLFRQAYGTTPHGFLTEVRLSRARALLAKSEMPVGQVAWEVGFESESAFCRLFKSATASTPTEFRKNGQRFALVAGPD